MSSLLRKIISIILISGLIVSIILGILWLRLNNSEKMDADAAIPPGFFACIETGNYSEFTASLQEKSNIWKEFSNYKALNTMHTYFHQLDSMSNSIPELNELLDGEVILAVYPENNTYDYLLVFDSPDKNATDEILKLISSETGIEKKKVKKVNIYHLDFHEKDPGALVFAENKGLFLVSSSGKLLQRAIEHVEDGDNVFADGRYQKIKSTLGRDVEAHLYINFDMFEHLAGKFIQEEKVPDFSGFTSIAAFDIEINPDQLLFNGFSSLSDTSSLDLTFFSGQKAVEQRLFSFIPSTVVYLKWTGISDTDRFLELLDDREPVTGAEAEFRKSFYSLYEGQAAEMIIKKEKGIFPRFLLIPVKSKGLAERQIIDDLEENSDDRNISEKVIRIDENIEITAYNFPGIDMDKIIFPGVFSNYAYDWLCFYGNNLIMAKSTEALKEFVYLNSLGKTLENDDYFQSLKEYYSSRSNFFIYVDPSQYYPEILEALKAPVKQIIDNNAESWKKINIVGFQSTVADDLHYFRFFVNYTGKIREFVNTVWERKLNAKLAHKPAVVLNHNNGEKEIFIQDEDHNIYLINNNGVVLWKQKIDESILGKIYQIDYYNNGKLQYLFNTREKIYLIDRNGNNVEKYPVILRQQASAGLALFDYDKNGQYRIAIPTVEKDILMYDNQGDIVTGWRFKKSDQIITKPVKHYRIGDRDYIVARDDYNLYILNRRGRARIKPGEQIDFSLKNPVYFSPAVSGNKERLIASDRGGNVYAFYFDGSTERIMDRKMSPDHFFHPFDLDGDGLFEYIFLDGSKLEVFNNKSDLLFSQSFPGNIQLPPMIYSFSANDKKIGIVDTESQRIYLFNNDGSLYNGFPLQGSSLFSISSFPGLKDRFNLLVGNNDNFLYNYSVK